MVSGQHNAAQRQGLAGKSLIMQAVHVVLVEDSYLMLIRFIIACLQQRLRQPLYATHCLWTHSFFCRFSASFGSIKAKGQQRKQITLYACRTSRGVALYSALRIILLGSRSSCLGVRVILFSCSTCTRRVHQSKSGIEMSVAHMLLSTPFACTTDSVQLQLYPDAS